jgi:hypothetical protein
MTFRRRRMAAVTALFLAVAVTQVYLAPTFGSPTSAAAPLPEPQRLNAAILTVRGNKPIMVNGADANTGATILTGAILETPDSVSAVIDLGDAGIVELQPGSKIQLDFDANGNVRVKQMKGCSVVRRKNSVLANATSEIYTDQASEKTNKNRKHMGFCVLPDNSLAPIAGAAAGGGGLSSGVIAAILVGTIGVLLGIGLRGDDPSPSSP